MKFKNEIEKTIYATVFAIEYARYAELYRKGIYSAEISERRAACVAVAETAIICYRSK